MIKEKRVHVSDLKQSTMKNNQIKGLKNKDRSQIDKEILNETKQIEELDEDLEVLIQEEINTHLRVLKLCEFLVKYCKVNPNCKIINNFSVSGHY